jgi:hypothetical protein
MAPNQVAIHGSKLSSMWKSEESSKLKKIKMHLKTLIRKQA